MRDRGRDVAAPREVVQFPARVPAQSFRGPQGCPRLLHRCREVPAPDQPLAPCHRCARCRSLRATCRCSRVNPSLLSGLDHKPWARPLVISSGSQGCSETAGRPSSIAGLSEGATLIKACLFVGRLSRLTSGSVLGGSHLPCLLKSRRAKRDRSTALEKLRAARRSDWTPLIHLFLWAGSAAPRVVGPFRWPCAGS
jgi:hypothetical protein